jgi:hypothetical protein
MARTGLRVILVRVFGLVVELRRLEFLTPCLQTTCGGVIASQ